MKKLTLIFGTLIMLGYLMSCGMPKGIGIGDNGKLKEPPKTPNCVSTQADTSDHTHYMEAWTFDQLSSAKEKILKAIEDFGNTKVISQSDRYIHAVFTTGWMKYRDDVEFYFDENEKLIHFRSASRVGIGDMGVNRKRMKRLKEMYLSE
ncbi:MAG: DUF1499 domain-containing protein [Flavobacteriales bacterium]|nr:DUF1499 domain-containing protein [Flavobacteriales bacterium]